MKIRRHSYLVLLLLTACAASGQVRPTAADAAADAAAQAAAAAASAGSDEPENPTASDKCPVLPADSGLAWIYQQGPDFGVCYATIAGSDSNAFGIYLGNHPNFDPGQAVPLGKGKVAGRDVIWYQQEKSDDSSVLARQTLIVLDKKWDYVAHIWVNAETQQDLQARLSVLERMAFR